MRRYFIYLKFDGSKYHGWQIQPNAMSVQEELQNALSTLFQQEIEIVGAGRTDTGVHATQMVAHFDIEEEVDERNFIHRINSILSPQIAIDKIAEVNHEAHARFDADSRTYRYYINRNKDPFKIKQAFYFKHRLDVEQMNTAANLLLGEKDFSCFSKSHTQTFTNLCDIKEAYWEWENDNLLVFQIKANRFLRNMVRAIVGTLIEVGEGKISVENIEEIIASKDRSSAGPSVPADGLYLTEVSYPNSIFK